MSVILVLSPHLDDAAFSVGPLVSEIAGRAKVIVATAFTKSEKNLSKFALACQLDKGLSSEVDYMAIRRQEDLVWAKRIGVEVIHGLLAEAPHRGYQSANELFEPILAADLIEKCLKEWLVNLTSSVKPRAILCPLGVGKHVDHVWINKVARETTDAATPLFFFKDQPYSQTLTNFRIRDFSSDKSSWNEFEAPFSQESCTNALFAAEAYKTQIKFQFKHVNQMKEILQQAWKQKLPLFYTHKLDESCEKTLFTRRN